MMTSLEVTTVQSVWRLASDMLILASKSPRRKELLKLLNQEFIVDAVDIPEDFDVSQGLLVAIEQLAYRKALPIFKLYPKDMVIGADTIVVNQGEIFGKPTDYHDAKRMLKALSGNTHQVITGVSIISKEKSYTFHEVTDVTFYPLNEDDIDAYITREQPFDKAGAYAIQEGAAQFVKSINGDFYNIVGLPVGHLSQVLKQLK